MESSQDQEETAGVEEEEVNQTQGILKKEQVKMCLNNNLKLIILNQILSFFCRLALRY